MIYTVVSLLWLVHTLFTVFHVLSNSSQLVQDFATIHHITNRAMRQPCFDPFDPPWCCLGLQRNGGKGKTSLVASRRSDLCPKSEANSSTFFYEWMTFLSIWEPQTHNKNHKPCPLFSSCSEWTLKDWDFWKQKNSAFLVKSCGTRDVDNIPMTGLTRPQLPGH